MGEIFAPGNSTDLPELRIDEDESMRLLLIQEGMEQELIDSGIVEKIVDMRDPHFNKNFSAKFFPYMSVDGQAVEYIVTADVFSFDVKLGKKKVRRPWVKVGVEKDGGELEALNGFELNQAKLVKSMLMDLQYKKMSGELSNLDSSLSYIQ